MEKEPMPVVSSPNSAVGSTGTTAGWVVSVVDPDPVVDRTSDSRLVDVDDGAVAPELFANRMVARLPASSAVTRPFKASPAFD